MRLQAGCFGTFHFFSHMRNTAGVHCVIGERSLLNQVLDMVAIDGVSDGFSQARADEQRTLENKL